MDRRDAIKSLAALAGSTGISVTPVTAKEAQAACMVVLKVPAYTEPGTMERLGQLWEEAVKGTPLQGVKAVVITHEIELLFINQPHIDVLR